MSYTTPSTASSGGTLTTTLWNTQVRDNLNYLYAWGSALAGTAGTAWNLTSVAGTLGASVNLTNTQGSVASTQGSVAALGGTAGTAWSITAIAGTAGTAVNLTATQGSVAATQGSVAALGGTAGTAWSITTIAGTAGTAVNLTSTQGSVAAIAGTLSANTQAQPIGTISTNYTLGTADAGKFFRVTGNATVTVPANGSAAFAIGQRMDFIQTGGSNLGVSFSAASGTAGTVTIYYTPSATLRALYSGASLVKLDTNTWALVGDLN
jgi:hypothetical protein